MANILTPEQVQRVKSGLSNWAWLSVQQALSGVNVTTAPASESGEHRNGVIRCAATAAGGKQFLMSIRAGWSEVAGQAPAALLAAVGGTQEAFLSLKNRVQATIGLNPTLASHKAILDVIVPDHAHATIGQSFPIPPMTIEVIGLRFAPSRTGAGVAQTSKGNIIWNFSDIRMVDMREMFEDGPSISRAAQAQLDATVVAKQLGLTIGLPQTEQQPVSRADVQDQAFDPAQIAAFQAFMAANKK